MDRACRICGASDSMSLKTRTLESLAHSSLRWRQYSFGNEVISPGFLKCGGQMAASILPIFNSGSYRTKIMPETGRYPFKYSTQRRMAVSMVRLLEIRRVAWRKNSFSSTLILPPLCRKTFPLYLEDYNHILPNKKVESISFRRLYPPKLLTF